MKNLFLGLVLMASTQLFAQIETPQPSPMAKVNQVVGLTQMSYEYSRPATRGREVFGNLVPFGKVWRTGANSNTVVSFGDDVVINGKTLAKGSYALYSIPHQDKWEIMFYSDTSNWGTPRTWDESKVALKIETPSSALPMNVENFTILVNNLKDSSADLQIMWEKTAVSFTVEVPTEEKAMASIEKTMSGPSARDYFNAATFYHESGKDLNKALEYAEKSVEMSPNAYWMARRLALIQADMGKTKLAIKTAKKSLELAEKAGNMDYVKMNKESIEAWSK